nr:hypothetical protein [Candidatus Sigynarchaeum springense]
MVLTVDLNKVNKLTTGLLIIGILCVAVAGPVLNQGFSNWPVVIEQEMNIPEGSYSNITQAYTYKHTVISDNTLSLKITVTGQESRVYVRVYTLATFNTLTQPSNTNLQSFVVSVPNYGANPSGSTYTTYDSGTIGRVGNIDFGGSTDGSSRVVLVPNDYVIVVYGYNGTSTAEPTQNVRFKLQITTEVIGRIWGRLVNTVGWILIISCGIISMLFWIKKTMEVGR